MLERVLRIAVFALVAAETLAVLFVIYSAITAHSDPAGQGMAQGYAFAAVVLWVLLALPAAALAWRRAWLPFALCLVALPAAVLVLVLI